MNARRAILTVAVVAVWVSIGQQALAQRNYPYQPARPLMSPYLNLYRVDSGPLDNYNTFVRPEMALRATLQQQQLASRRQSAGVRALGDEMRWSGQTGMIRPTGAGASFMNLSHYYPMPGPIVRRR